MSFNSPDGLRFHRDHLWVKPAGNENEGVIGLSDFAQKQLGKILFVELPRTGEHLEVGAAFGTVESYKVVSDLIAPASGEVLETNVSLKQAAGLLNDDCYGAGWLVRIKFSELEDFSTLFTADSYSIWLGDRAK
ncbi:glycine cleavage system protein GcvH [Hyphomicrobium sp.]|uniref:glycine cleavage system protein H n=1 Tax=Hyphomicrobium sp. TaxID=82 RepID=UPI002E30C92B|nr:glycine cleavage system protein GcvH [Hyphomicrobium sp.]HEX2841243.1 glycine cleavage system protein GcvH [Hyphomicrobium sp.]